MMKNYSRFGSVLNRIYGLEHFRHSEFLTKFHLAQWERLRSPRTRGRVDESGRSGNDEPQCQFWKRMGKEFEQLLSAVHEKYGHIHPMVEMVLRYISPESGLHGICERLQSDYKMMQQDLDVIKSFIMAKTQQSAGNISKLHHEVTDILQCSQEVYSTLTRSSFEDDGLFCRDEEPMVKLLTYRVMNLMVDLDDLQIVIASVLKHDLIAALSPFRRLSQREANSMGDDVVDENPTNGTDVEDDGRAKPEDIRRDRDRVLLSYFVTMNFRNIGSPQSEEEERSKHGYEVVQYMGYKLHGTAHNIAKSAHHNTVDTFDQIKKEATVGSNHCDEQYRQEMATALLTGCFHLFKMQTNSNNVNNPRNGDREEKNQWNEHMLSEDIAESNTVPNIEQPPAVLPVTAEQEARCLPGDDAMEWRERNVAEQLHSMIEDATDSNRLCRMYEGWAPWM